MVGVAFDERSDRAQLILVGAVAIAFIVLGLAVVFNTVLYTENVASTGAASAPRDAQLLNDEVEVSVKRLAERVNAKGAFGNPVDQTEAYDGITANVSTYSDGLTKVAGAASPAVASVRVSSSSADVTYGARIQDKGGSDFTAPGGAPNWTLMQPPGGDAIVRDFDMTVERSSLTAGGQDAFRVMWSPPSSNENHVVWIYEKSSTSEVAIRTVNDSPQPYRDFSGTECVLPGSDSASTVTFNFSDGNVQGYDACDGQLGPWEAIDNGTARNVTFIRGDSVQGSYSLTMNDEPELNPTLQFQDASLGAGEPFVTWDAWEFEIEVRYDSGQATFTEEYYVEVYNRSR
ncbi:DUF7261 family protein [Halorubellus litoreus]|uniref:Flagellin N-terminal-like domain-containing protein n=1 Tax=Halorubellus litoreus TaxID=755308 RepID=A0ABD5VHX5_9EURY